MVVQARCSGARLVSEAFGTMAAQCQMVKKKKEKLASVRSPSSAARKHRKDNTTFERIEKPCLEKHLEELRNLRKVGCIMTHDYCELDTSRKSLDSSIKRFF